MKHQEDSVKENKDDSVEIDLIGFFRDYWKKLSIAALLGGTVATGIAFLIPEKYQATANIQAAKVENKDVELPNILLEKMKMPLYYSPTTLVSCAQDGANSPAEALINTLKISSNKNAPIINVIFKGNSPEAAEHCLTNILNDVRENQKLIAKPIIESKRYELKSLNEKLTAAENLQKALSPKKFNYDFNDPKFSAAALLQATILKNDIQIKDLRQDINTLELSLVEPQTRDTYLTTPIYTSNVPVEPKKFLFTLVGSVLGVLSMLIVLLSRNKRWSNLPDIKNNS